MDHERINVVFQCKLCPRRHMQLFKESTRIGRRSLVLLLFSKGIWQDFMPKAFGDLG